MILELLCIMLGSTVATFLILYNIKYEKIKLNMFEIVMVIAASWVGVIAFLLFTIVESPTWAEIL